MAKITKFSQDIQFYYNMAMTKTDDDDYTSALHYLRLAIKICNDPYSRDDLELRLEIADIYSLMGLYNLSNSEYFKLTPYEYCSEEIFYGIIKNYALSDMAPQAAYYLNLCLEMGILHPDDGFSPVDLKAFNRNEMFHVVKPNDNSYLLAVAKQLIGSHDPEFARAILNKISKDSKKYSEASAYLALLEIKEGNIEKAIEYCDEALKKDKKDLSALSTKIFGLKVLKKADELSATIKYLDELDLSEFPETAKITLCMADAKEDELTYKYAKRALNFAPYDKDILLLFAQACFNLNKKTETKNAMVTLGNVYPDDYTIFYFAKSLALLKKGEKANLTCELSPQVKRSLLKEFDEKLKEIPTASALVSKLFSDQDFYRIVLWGLKNAGEKRLNTIAESLCKTKKGFNFLQEILLDPDYSVISKKIFLNQALKSGASEFIQILVNHQIQWFKPKMPKVAKTKALKNAYWKVYGTLAFISSDFDKKLNMWYKKLATLIEPLKIKNPNEDAIAAVLAYKSKTNKIFSQKNYCCEVFDCSGDEFEKYITLFSVKKAKIL